MKETLSSQDVVETRSQGSPLDINLGLVWGPGNLGPGGCQGLFRIGLGFHQGLGLNILVNYSSFRVL